VHVIELVDFDETGIFHASAHFIGRFRCEHRLGLAVEVNAIRAIGVAKARDAIGILCAIKHHYLVVVTDDGGIECACGFPACTLGRNHGRLGDALPLLLFRCGE
jgi:hypothetical protein